MRQKSCKPGGDCCVTGGAVDAQGHLILTLANRQAVDVGAVAPLYAEAAPCTVPSKLLGADGQQYATETLWRTRTVYGVSPLVSNPTTGIANWAAGQTESTPITTLTLRNPSACWPMTVEAKVLHLLVTTYANTLTQATKTQSFAAYSYLTFDNGSGVLQALSLSPQAFGQNQLDALALPNDVGTGTGVGVSAAQTNVVYLTVPPGGVVTLRAQAKATVADAGTNVLLWVLTQLAALGFVG